MSENIKQIYRCALIYKADLVSDDINGNIRITISYNHYLQIIFLKPGKEE